MEEMEERTELYGSMVRYSIGERQERWRKKKKKEKKGKEKEKHTHTHTHTHTHRKKRGKQKKNLQRSRGGRRVTLHVTHTTFGENEFLSCRSSCIPCWEYIAGDIKVLADIVCINYNQ